MSDVKKAILSKAVQARSRTYYFDVKKTVKGNKYLTISETRKRNGGVEKHMLMVFEDHFENFFKAFNEIEAELK